ncbi:MAG: class I SAM-dependent methyltransferase [Bacteroidia bacterium]
MNWEAFWDKQAGQLQQNQQVGRINSGNRKREELDQRIANHISIQLELQPTDRLLDVCCGNGSLSNLLAPKVYHCLGVDFSQQLIAKARLYESERLYFVRADAMQLSGLGQSFNKINLYFSFQYFDSYEKGLRVLSEMNSLLEPGGRIFIGDTPDARKWHLYYNSPIKKLRYYYQRFKGKEPMGKFWQPQEFEKMAEWLGLNVQIFAEPEDLPYAWYRFDAVFIKSLA